MASPFPFTLFASSAPGSLIDSEILGPSSGTGSLCNGWVLRLRFTRMASGGAIDPTKVSLSVTSLGFDRTSAAIATQITRVRTLSATAYLRQVYPNGALSYLLSVAGNYTDVYFVLSGVVYQRDWNSGTGASGITPTIILSAGAYVAGGVTSAAAIVSLAKNSSTQAYPVPQVAYMDPDSQVFGANPVREIAVIHRHFEQEAMAAGARCRIVASGVTYSATATTMTASALATGGKTVPVFSATPNLTGAATAAGIEDWDVFPWIGDMFTLSAQGNTWPTPYVSSRPVVVDPAGTYGKVYACVDPVSGVDASGVAYVSTALVNDATAITNAESHAYLTIGAALNACKALNNSTFSRNNHAACHVRIKAGTLSGLGVAVTAPASALATTWGHLELATGVTAGAAVINIGAQKDLFTMTRIGTGVALGDGGTASWLFRGPQNTAHTGGPISSAIWLDSVQMSAPSAAFTGLIFGYGLMWHTNAAMTNCLTMQPGSDYFNHYHFIGNAVSYTGAYLGSGGTSTVSCAPYSFIGNMVTGNLNMTDAVAGNVALSSDNGLVVLANYFSTNKGNGGTLKLSNVGNSTPATGIGAALNCVEQMQSTSPAWWFSADDTTTETALNINNICNTIAGSRNNQCYNSTASNGPLKEIVSFSLVIGEGGSLNQKSDYFAPPSALRTGNWFGRYFVAGGYVVAQSTLSPNPPAYDAWAGEIIPVGSNLFTNAALGFKAPDVVNGGGDYRPAIGSTYLTSIIPYARRPFPFGLAGAGDVVASNANACPGAFYNAA